MSVKDKWLMKQTMQYKCYLMPGKLNDDDDDNVWDNLLRYIDRMRSLKDSKEGFIFIKSKNKELTQIEAVEHKTSITNHISQNIFPKYQIPNVEYEAENGRTAIPNKRSLKAKLIIR